MKCKYVYNNRVFESEADLDEYLLVTSALKPSLGDIVFKNWSKQQLTTLDKINGSNKAVEDAIKRGEVKAPEEEGEPEDMDGLKGNGRYKSITELIHEIRTVDSDGLEHPLFPIFVEDNYWNGPNNSGGLLEKYRLGKYNDPKVAVQIPFVEDLIPKVGDLLQPVTDSNTLLKIRERMTDVWKLQALCGDVVHAILSDFYKSKTNNGRRFCTLSESELKLALKRKVTEDYYKKYLDYISDSLIDSMVVQALKIDKEIREKYGEDCMILSEKKVSGTGVFGNDSIPIVGKMDLFVVSRDGRMGILDFKCSPKEYTEFNELEDPTKYDPAKIRTFQYLLAAYRRLLNSIGINSSAEIDLAVIPLQFLNYRFDSNTKKVQFDGVSSLDTAIQMLPNTKYTTGGNLYHTIESNLEQIFPSVLNLENLSTGEILSAIQDEEKILFKELAKKKNMSDEDITKYIQSHGGVKKNKITNNWEFKYSKFSDKDKETVSGTKSQAEAEAQIFDRVKQKFLTKEDYIPITTSSIRKDFMQARETGDNVEFYNYSGNKSYSGEDPLWLQKQLGKYNNTIKYLLLSKADLDPVLDLLGILLFKNKITGLIDVVKISGLYDPTRLAKLGGENSKNRNSLLGTFIADEVVNADSNSQVMEGVVGNVELMEAMLVINKLPQLFLNDIHGVGKIELIVPRSLKGLTASNEQLLDNFRRLCKLGKITNNFIDEKNNTEGTIKMASYVDICKATFNEILESPNKEKGLGKIYDSIKNEIRSCLSDLDNFGENPQILRLKLIELDRDLVDKYHLTLEKGTILSEETNPEYKLHQDILFAISQLSGVKLLLLIEDHAKFTLAGGISGTMIDNPGTLLSKTLNEFTDLVTKAYLNVRDNVIAFNQELRLKVEALKKHKKFGLVAQYTVGNQVASLYLNMFDPESEDLMFLNPWDYTNNLDDPERDFLKFALLKINDNRIKNFDPNNIENLIKSNPTQCLRVPLIKGDLTSEIAVRGGWMNFIRSRFAMLSPSRLKERFDKAATNLLNSTQQEKIENGDMWEAINSFDASEGKNSDEYRQQLLSNESLGGKSYFEHNIETLLLKHTSAYKMADELNNIFPVLRALTLNLNALGAILNDKFQNDLEYILKYVKTRIHNQPVENRKDGLELVAADVTKTMMSTASKLALAFNPRLWYQFLDGLWKDCLLYFRNAPEEGTPFTREGLMNGWKLAMSDLAHFGNNFTMGELLNQLYGFNDMDANSYIDRIKTDNTGLLYHFWNVGFRFASRPDYYNRMTIFYAQMHKDGSLDAHKMADGKLVYDWTKDKRFDAFAKGDKSNLEKYNKQKSLYITMGLLLEQEGARNKDGTLFKLDLKNIQPLPKAYTNQLSEGMKALSDRIYGYYAHEKKSMIHSSLVGSMIMQMYTYWSAKKNQYAQTRSFTQEGDWALYEENGQLYYWKEDEDGDLIPTTENTGVPLQVWKGRPLEGIFLTGWEVIKAFAGKSDMTTKSGIVGIQDLFNNEEIDPQVRRLYSSNMRLLISDLLIWWLIGTLLLGSIETQVKDYAKASGNDSVSKAFTNTLLSGGTQILKASTMDANFLDSIWGRGKDWTPFSIQTTERLADNIIKVGTGKQDLYDFLIKSNGSTNATKPMWDYVKVSTLGRKIGLRAED